MWFEQIGMQPLVGRLLAWLIVCQPPQQSSKDLAGALGASPGAISTTAKVLTQMSMIERVRIRGDRKTYFRVVPGIWTQRVRAEMALTVHLRQIAEEGLDVLDRAGHETDSRLEELRDMAAFFEREFPAMIERWEASRKNKQ
jgi:DNA-binding transcriptional regulator GbsR (MarR family)